jgi:photosynthetic reaction center H subunit
MIRGAVTSYIDVAQIVLYAFFAFFAGLVFYLRREDRREGYPLESEAFGRQKERGFLLIPTPKTFQLAHGTANAPRFDVDPRTPRAGKVAPWPGAPLDPTGDPMTAEVGPGAYALRADVAELTHDGLTLLAPMRVATNYAVANEDGNPLGMTVVGADGKVGGVVRDLWVDRAEGLLRYYEVETGAAGATKRVLLPVTFSNVNFWRREVKVEAIRAAQFAGVPATRDPNSVTRLEEEKITAYFGAGTLYATPQRTESLL